MGRALQPGFHCRMEAEDDIVVVHLEGEIDLASAPVLADTLAAAFRQRRGVMVDLADVSYIDASGLRILQNAAQTHVGRFAVARPSKAARRLFDLVHLADMIPIMASLDAGRAHLSVRFNHSD